MGKNWNSGLNIRYVVSFANEKNIYLFLASFLLFDFTIKVFSEKSMAIIAQVRKLLLKILLLGMFYKIIYSVRWNISCILVIMYIIQSMCGKRWICKFAISRLCKLSRTRYCSNVCDIENNFIVFILCMLNIFFVPTLECMIFAL